MAIPNEKLQSVRLLLNARYPPALRLIKGQLLREIESKAAFSSQQLQIVRGQISSKTREKRMLELSSTELDGLPRDTPVYDGVGKMYDPFQPPDHSCTNSYLQVRTDIHTQRQRTTNKRVSERSQGDGELEQEVALLGDDVQERSGPSRPDLQERRKLSYVYAYVI